MQKLISTVLLLLSSYAFSDDICTDYPVAKTELWQWSESDFNEAAAKKGLSAINEAMLKDSFMGVCELPNTLAVIEGYILKKQAQEALDAVDLDKGLKQLHLNSFCEYVRFAHPCE